MELVEGEAAGRMARIIHAIMEAVQNQEAMIVFRPDGEAYRDAWELGRIRKQQSFSIEELVRDQVTDLYNKSYFHGRLIEELRRAVRYSHDITLVLFEIDNFHEVSASGSEEDMRNILRLISASLARMTRD